jgi:hypothetical protein
VLALAASVAPAQDLKTRIGKIEVERGYPSQASIKELCDEMDFQRAVQAYLWAMPAVALNELRLGLDRDLGVGNDDIVIFDNYVNSKAVFLTANNTTIYIGREHVLRQGRLDWSGSVNPDFVE